MRKLNIKDFLEHCFKVSDYDGFADLQWILNKLVLPETGRKDDLIDRIADNERFHPNKLYKWLKKDDLREICRRMGLKVSGNKTDFWLRILEETNYFNNEYPNISSFKKVRDYLKEQVF